MKTENIVRSWQFGTITTDPKYTILMANWIWKKEKEDCVNSSHSFNTNRHGSYIQ
jgi:hypothetical protein